MKTGYTSTYYEKYDHYVQREQLGDVPLFARILDWVCENRSKRILEIGCGLGYLGHEILQRTGCRVIGLELSTDALKGARTLYENSVNVQADALDIPIDTSSLDCVLAINVIEHLSEVEQHRLMAEIRRVLEPGGILLISTPETRSVYARIMINDATHSRELQRDKFVDLIGGRLILEEIVYTNSIGKLPAFANKAASLLFPADLLIMASRSAKSRKSRDFMSEYLAIYPAAHALARASEAKVLAEAEIEDPILDLGCGDGTFTSKFFGGPTTTIGVDLSLEAMKIAANQGTYKALVVADGSSLPFASHAFNTIFSNSVFEHLISPGQVLSETRRLLSARGTLVYTVPNQRTREWWFKNAAWRWIKDTVWNHANLSTRDWWNIQLTDAGFAAIEFREFANRKFIRVLDVLFLPAAIWFALASIRIRLPLPGRFQITRSLIRRLLEERYWNNERGKGASFLIQASNRD